MMYEAIRNFAKQFAWEPRIENGTRLERRGRVVVAGMGGSNLASGLLKIWKSESDIVVHNDYGLPALDEAARQESMLVASSYSGNTEETLDAYEEAKRRGMPVAAISTGGELLARAARDGRCYIQMPDTNIQPRSALGFSFKALLKVMGDESGLAEAGRIASILDPAVYEEQGKDLAHTLKEYVPVIYSSRRNAAIGYNWKIKLNETAKIPAFVNVLPELNHNEMTGFDIVDSTRALSAKFFFIFLKDSGDHHRIARRMEATMALYRDRGLPLKVVELIAQDGSILYKIFSSLVLADWAAYFIAQGYGVEAEQVPMVEEFKKRIALK